MNVTSMKPHVFLLLVLHVGEQSACFWPDSSRPFPTRIVRAQTCHILGEGCDLGDPCCDGLVCTAGLVCAETFSVVADPCTVAGDCCQELACSPAGACYDPNCGGEGASCDPPGAEGSHQLCCPGFYCHPAGRCVSDATPSCSAVDDPCFSGDECCEGLGCHSQLHTCIERGGGFLCIDDSDCNTDEACDPTGRCRQAAGTCSEQGGPCSTHFECCGLLQCQDYGDGSGYCGDGICGTADAYCGEAPLGAIPCCDGYQCVADECVACAAKGAACGESADSASVCCTGLTCSESNVCVAEGDDCLGEGASCDVDGDCCESLSCRDGLCVLPVEDGESDTPETGEGSSDATQLPATGSGRNSGGSDAVLLWLATLAAAVAVAVRRVRERVRG